MSIIYYLKTSEKGDVSIRIWHLIKVKQKVGQRQNRCCCIRWTAISESDRETWSIPKNKAESDCAPDGTTYELRNVLIYVAHDTHAINKTSGEMKERVYSHENRNHRRSLPVTSLGQMTLLFLLFSFSFSFFVNTGSVTDLRTIIIVSYHSSL